MQKRRRDTANQEYPKEIEKAFRKLEVQIKKAKTEGVVDREAKWIIHELEEMIAEGNYDESPLSLQFIIDK